MQLRLQLVPLGVRARELWFMIAQFHWVGWPATYFSFNQADWDASRRAESASQPLAGTNKQPNWPVLSSWLMAGRSIDFFHIGAPACTTKGRTSLMSSLGGLPAQTGRPAESSGSIGPGHCCGWHSFRRPASAIGGPSRGPKGRRLTAVWSTSLGPPAPHRLAPMVIGARRRPAFRVRRPAAQVLRQDART